MLFWLLIATSPAQEAPPPDRAPSTPLSSGALLRALARDAGFSDIIGATDAAGPPTEGPQHAPMPPGAGGHSAPGFALEVRLPAPPALLSASVAREQFALADDGSGEDVQAGDGVWTAMVERYPPGHPLVVQAGDAVLFEGEIALRQTGGVPRMTVDLTR